MKPVRKRTRKVNRRGDISATEAEMKGICDVLSYGGTVSQAEENLGLGDGTARHWMIRGKQDAAAGKKSVAATFYQNATRARAVGKRRLQEMVWKAATEGFEVTITEVVERDGVKTTRVKKTTFVKPELALEILARRWPDEWGRGVRVQVDDMPKEDPRDRDPEEREHLLRILSKKYAPKRGSLLDGIVPRRGEKEPGQDGEVGANGSGNGQHHEPDEDEPPPDGGLNGKA